MDSFALRVSIRVAPRWQDAAQSRAVVDSKSAKPQGQKDQIKIKVEIRNAVLSNLSGGSDSYQNQVQYKPIKAQMIYGARNQIDERGLHPVGRLERTGWCRGACVFVCLCLCLCVCGFNPCFQGTYKFANCSIFQF